jgi:transposase
VKRTRKWAYVEQEAKRLVSLGLGHLEIAKRLGVNDSTIRRWVKAGKLEKRTTRQRRAAADAAVPTGRPAKWAAAVRKDFSPPGGVKLLARPSARRRPSTPRR